MRTFVERSGQPGLGHRRDRGEPEDDERQHRDRKHRELDLARLDLLADIFGRTPDHQTGHENREDREEQEAIDPRADAADHHFAQLHVEQRDQAAKRGEAVVHGIDRAA